MSEDEFWRSTAAKVFKLADKRDYYDERRDYFISCVAALLYNDDLAPGLSKLTPRKVLDAQYREKKSVMITHNPDLGAITDGNLKAMFEKRIERAKKRGKQRS